MRKSYYFLAILFLGSFLFKTINNSETLETEKVSGVQTAGFIPSLFIKSNSVNSVLVADTLTWKLLGQIKYVKKPSKDYPEGVMFPVINNTLKTKSKKTIIMSGFIIPIDNKTYALSKNVFAACFFCGQAGPETIMGIKFRTPNIKLKTDQYVTLQGVFRYNDNDVDDWIYHIDDAVILKK